MDCADDAKRAWVKTQVLYGSYSFHANSNSDLPCHLTLNLTVSTTYKAC